MEKKTTYIWSNSAVTNALIDKLSDSQFIEKLYYGNSRVILKNSTTFRLATDGIALIKELKEKHIDFIFSNSEANSNGFIDIASNHNIKTIGASYKSTLLEASKIYAKMLMTKYNIKTAKYITVNDFSNIKDAIDSTQLPFFIKADGYARSLSSVRVESKNEAFYIAEKYLNGYFGNSSKRILFEENIDGIEMSIPLILDSKTIKILFPIKDYKRKYNKNIGPNTGGMGSFGPVVLSEKQSSLLFILIEKLKILLTKENLFYKGFMTINVIFTEDDIYLLEINTRLGDSEGQVFFKLLKTDLMLLFDAVLTQRLDTFDIKYNTGFAAAVNIINKYYPNRSDCIAYISKKSICKISKIHSDFYFYNNIKQTKKRFFQKNNRFISVVSSDISLVNLDKKIYKVCKQIKGKNIFFRTDIVQDNYKKG